MKAILRLQNLAKRNQLSKREVAEKSRIIQESILALPEFRQAKTIMLYFGIDNEVETSALIEKSLLLGKKVCLPVTDFEKKHVKAIEISSLSELRQTGSGLLEPTGEKEADPGKLSLIFLPGVAFDKKGNRIGRGGGYYDSLLRKVSTKVLLIGLCFEENLEESIPAESHDVKMDLVITDRQTIRCKE